MRAAFWVAVMSIDTRLAGVRVMPVGEFASGEVLPSEKV